MNESYEMTFTLKDADMRKLAEIFGDININDCPYFEIQDKYGNSAKYYRENPSSAQPETNCSEIPNNWIPCSERLPETEGVYIITDDAGGMATVELDKFICRDDGWFTWLYAQNATAWMPLPEPYRGEEK